MKLTKEPAVVLGLVAAVAAAIVQALEASSAGGSLDVWTLVLVLVPLLAGVGTRFAVIPVQTVKDVIARADTATEAVGDLSRRVDVAITDQPHH